MVKSVLIIGAGPGLSASLARLCSKQGMKVALAARNIAKLEELSKDQADYIGVGVKGPYKPEYYRY